MLGDQLRVRLERTHARTRTVQENKLRSLTHHGVHVHNIDALRKILARVNKRRHRSACPIDELIVDGAFCKEPESGMGPRPDPNAVCFHYAQTPMTMEYIVHQGAFDLLRQALISRLSSSTLKVPAKSKRGRSSVLHEINAAKWAQQGGFEVNAIVACVQDYLIAHMLLIR
jgi:hypothetical protein